MKQRKLIINLLLLMVVSVGQAQTIISGKVTDQKGETLPGANVYLKDTFDGTNTQSDGTFKFETEESGDQNLGG